MTYFLLLPALVLAGVGISFLAQRAFAHFVDTSALTRVALLLALVWALLGWKMEAREGAKAASAAHVCQIEVARDLRNYERIVQEALGL